ncbi:MAG: hypothetical protein ACM33T_06915 [Solirubrobacterales bacterium]
MSKYEERAFQVGKTKADLGVLKNQLARMKEDLVQFTARKQGGSLVGPLRERIRALEGEIAAMEQARKRERVPDEGPDASPPGQAVRQTTGRYAPRRR